MARTKTVANSQPQTTAQALGSVIKSARDIMRKDKGLSGDLDRLPLLTWIMFLKFLDDLEIQREEEAKLKGDKFRAAIDRPYRWRDWAAAPDGPTGDELLRFINQEELLWPDARKKGVEAKIKGLFAYLRGLTSSNGDDRREVIATVFRGVDNRMKSGYLLRDVINKINDIHFTSSQELSTLGTLYESMLREMRDAAGDSGEFYTPRPLVRFIVEVTDPRLGEIMLDPAAGTGGFLAAEFDHLSKQVKTVADRNRLQTKTLFGIEAKPLPYLLCQMNLLLHGLDSPSIDPNNALRFKLSEIGEKDRVDIILTNPPFGGEEEKGIQANFPNDRQTAETALLFLQLIMRKLRRKLTSADKPARAAVIVPNATLFAGGVCARIKEEMLKEFNLHTIIRLPRGVFSPYTDIATNILFFDRSGPTKTIWYYEHPLPEKRNNYTKTQAIQFDEFAPCIKWWRDRKENEFAWKVPATELLAAGCDLDRKNPRGKGDLAYLPPEQLAPTIIKHAERISELGKTFQDLFSSRVSFDSPRTALGVAIKQRKEFITIEESRLYKRVRVQLHARGLVLRDEILGSSIKTKKQQVCRSGEFLVAEIDAKVGGFGIVPLSLANTIVSSHYFLFEVDKTLLDIEFLEWVIRSREFRDQVEAQGSTNYAAIRPSNVLAYKIPLPGLDEQKAIVANMKSAHELAVC